MHRIPLDNAATSFPKPAAVYDVVDRYQRELGAPVGRGATRAAVEVQAIVDRARSRAAALLGAESPERVVFAFNGTDALNIALHGCVEPGGHVVTSVGEHNSVLRPLRADEERFGIEVTRVPVDSSGRVDPGDVAKAMRPNTRLVAIQHASNVTGVIQPIEEIGELARAAGALFLVDAAQSAGHLPIDLRDLPIDLLACSGHKGLLGPLGTGLLYVRPGVEERLWPLRQGGTGTRSEVDAQPESMPDRYESGNQNAPGLVGLESSLGWIAERGVAALREHEVALTARLMDGLRSIDGVRIPGPDRPEQRVGVVSISVEGFDPRELSTILDENFGIETRAGLHCAAGLHRAIGTAELGGTLRFGLGPFNTPEHVDAAVDALREIRGFGS